MDINTFKTIEHYQKQINDLFEKRKHVYYTVKSPSLSGIRATSPADPTAKAFYRLQAIDNKITDLICKNSEVTIEALNWMYNKPVPVDVRRILINKYMCGLSWKETARIVESTPAAARVMIYRYFKENGQ